MTRQNENSNGSAILDGLSYGSGAFSDVLSESPDARARVVGRFVGAAGLYASGVNSAIQEENLARELTGALGGAIGYAASSPYAVAAGITAAKGTFYGQNPIPAGIAAAGALASGSYIGEKIGYEVYDFTYAVTSGIVDIVIESIEYEYSRSLYNGQFTHYDGSFSQFDTYEESWQQASQSAAERSWDRTEARTGRDPRDDFQAGRDACFSANAQIALPEGRFKAIRDVAVGDHVLAFAGKGELRAARVTRLFVHDGCEVVDLDGLLVTANHPFLKADGSFAAVGEIEPGDLIILADGSLAPLPTAKPVPDVHRTYNFTVEGFHTYVAGGYRVHNKHAPPVVLDLNGDGEIGLTSLDESSAFFDIDDDGYLENLAWVAAGDGFLTIDLNDDGVIDQAEELNFTLHADAAETDLDGVRLAFDSNEDGVLDAADDRFEDFRVWQDFDGDGATDEGELESLSEAGIASIGLTGERIDEELEGGNVLFRNTEFIREDGTTGNVGDVGLGMSAFGVKIDESNPDEVTFHAEDGAIAHFGSDDADSFQAGDENTLLSGGEGDDDLFGASGHDWLIGGSGNDELRGGDGHDILVIDADDRTIDGGEGVDVAVVADDRAVDLNLADAGLEAILGGSGNDDFSTSGVEGVAIDGGGGGDLLRGGAGDDMLAGGEGADEVHGGAGNDILVVDDEDAYSGGEGVDTVIYQGDEGQNLNITNLGVEIFVAGDGDDTLRGDDNRVVVLDGGGGNDHLSGGWGGDRLSGGAGDDRLEGGFGNDRYRFNRGDGHDTVSDSFVYQEVGQSVDAGRDSLALGSDITLDDLIIRVVGDRLEIAVKDPENPGASFNNLADRVTIENWNDPLTAVERISLSDGMEVDTKKLVEWSGAAGSGEPIDIASRFEDGIPAFEDLPFAFDMAEVEDAGIVTAADQPSGASEIRVELVAAISGAGEAAHGYDEDEEEARRLGRFSRPAGGASATETLTLAALGAAAFAPAAAAEPEAPQGAPALQAAEPNQPVADVGVATTPPDGTPLANDAPVAEGDAPQADRPDIIPPDHEPATIVTKGQTSSNPSPPETRIQTDETAEASSAPPAGGEASGEPASASGEPSPTDQANAEWLAQWEVWRQALVGTNGDDLLVAEAGMPLWLIQGYAGTDTLVLDRDDDITLDLAPSSIEIAYGGRGDDTIGRADGTAVILHGRDGDDVLSGGAAADELHGDSGGDILRGDGGDDRFFGGAGGDRLEGGDGVDTASYGDSAAGVTIDLASGHGSGGAAEGDVLTGIEAVAGSGHDDVLIGDARDNLLSGGDGDDRLIGNGGADRLEGGAGRDRASYEAALGAVFIDLSTGEGFGSDAEGDQLAGIEEVVGGAHADTLIGDDGDNVLIAGAGDDALAGGAGADILTGGAGRDLAGYQESAEAVEVDLSTGLGVGGDAEGDQLSGVEEVLGSAHHDRLTGDGGDNWLGGGAGDDLLSGGAGADILAGGDGTDRASYADASEGVSVSLALGAGAAGEAAGDMLSGVEALTGSVHDDILAGDGAANAIDAGAGADTVLGDAGDDAVNGGKGDDILWGEAGADDIDGGAGVDEAWFAGTFYGYQVTRGEIGAATVTDIEAGIDGDEGTDIVTGVERLHFADRIIYLDGTNNRPDAIADRTTTKEDVGLVISGADLLTNDFDVDGEEPTLTGVSGAVNGTVELLANGNIVFTPDANFYGQARFDYTIADGEGGTHTTSVAIDVTPTPDPPRIVDYGWSDSWSSSGAHASLDIVDADTAADALSISIVGGDHVNIMFSEYSHYWGISAKYSFATSIMVSDPQGNAAYYTLVGEVGHVDAGGNDNGGNGGQTNYWMENFAVYQHVAAPIVIDFDGDGVELTNVAASTARYDMDGDGARDLTGWVGADDGLLVFDMNGDGRATGTSEIVISEHGLEGMTDLEALAYAFDSNADGAFTASDEDWARFGIWRDADQDGVTDDGEFSGLDEAGIAAISLQSDNELRIVEGNIVHGEAGFVRTDGSVGAVADATFNYKPADDPEAPAVEADVYSLDHVVLRAVEAMAAFGGGSDAPEDVPPPPATDIVWTDDEALAA